jgi:chitinase
VRVPVMTLVTPEQRAAAAPADPLALPVRDSRRISLWRVLALLLAVAVASASGWYVAQRTDGPSAGAFQPWFSPYVDVTATPVYPFEDPASAASANVVLSFIVASPSSSCTPTWGGVYTLAAAMQSLDLDRRIARLHQRGGTVAVSFGGAINDELATACADPVALAAAYLAVIQRYGVARVDLDIETPAAMDPAVVARRATALASVQRTLAAAGSPLSIWLTMPVAPTGLTASAQEVLDTTLAQGVTLGGVNVMTMDYGQSQVPGQTMGESAVAALQATHTQLLAAYGGIGVTLTAGQAWAKLGATPMIGQNDVSSEKFGAVDAAYLSDFAARVRLGRVSMWSLNRDTACGPNFADVTTVSDNCSGVDEPALAFSKILAKYTAGSVAAPTTSAPTSASTSAGAGRTTAIPLAGGAATVDDPATSPYPIWRAARAYAKGDKTVWHHNVYQAKYYTVGDTPDAPVASTSATPWQLIGPVLPGEHPAALPTLPAGTYLDWSATGTYSAGARVQYHGVGYQAKWWNQADVPGADVLSAADTPWAQLGADGTVSGS